MNIGRRPIVDDGRRAQVSEVWPCLVLNCNQTFTDPFEWITHDLEAHSPPGFVCDACPKRFTTPGGIYQHLKTEHPNAGDNYISCLMFIRSVNSPWGNPMWCGFCRKTIEIASLIDDYALLTVRGNPDKKNLWKEDRAARRCNHISEHLEKGSRVADWVQFQDHQDAHLTTFDPLSIDGVQFDMGPIMKLIEEATAKTGDMSKEIMTAKLYQLLKSRWNRTSAIDSIHGLVEWLSTTDLEKLLENETNLISALHREFKYGRPNIIRKIDDGLRAGKDYFPSASNSKDRNSSVGSGSSRGSWGSTASAAAQSDEDRSDVSMALLALRTALVNSVKKSKRKLKIIPSKTDGSRAQLKDVLEQGLAFVDKNMEEAYRLHTDDLASSLNQEMWNFTRDVVHQLDEKTSSWNVQRWNGIIQLATESLDAVRSTWEEASTRRSAFLQRAQEVITRYPSPHFDHVEVANIVQADAANHKMSG